MSDLMFKVVTVEEAKKSLEPFIKQLNRQKESVPIEKACGRYTSQNITVREDVPGFSRSTMDGFAVNSVDTFGASAAMPAYLEVAGEVKMGEEATLELSPGEAMQIATGGMLPPGADAVIMIEDTEWLDDSTIGVLKPVAPGENVVRKGEDISQGEILITENHCLRPQDLGALAAVGIDKVTVWKPLNTGIISTGNELVSPEERIRPGRIRDINSYTLYGLVQEAGGNPSLYGIVKDDFRELKERVEDALQDNDIVLLSGGSSVGTRDHTLRVLQEMEGFQILFHGISVKPGKPAITAAGNGKLVFGLPGHPVSAMVAFKVLVEPVVTGQLQNKQKLNFVKATITRSLSSTPGREDHVRVKLIFKEGQLFAEPVLGKSALINTMVKSHGEIVIPLGEEGVGAGEEVTVELSN